MAFKLKRLEKELNFIKNEKDANISANIVSDNMYHWHATIGGPMKTAYEGGIFELDIHIPNEFPHKPPKIQFITKVYHPNINESLHCNDVFPWLQKLYCAQQLFGLPKVRLGNPKSFPKS